MLMGLYLQHAVSSTRPQTLLTYQLPEVHGYQATEGTSVVVP